MIDESMADCELCEIEVFEIREEGKVMVANEFLSVVLLITAEVQSG